MNETCNDRCVRVWMETELQREARRKALEAAEATRRTTTKTPRLLVH